MTARKAFELAAVLLLPGVLLYGAGAFVSLEWDFREWSDGGRFALLSFWVALAIPLVIAWEDFRDWKEFR